LRVRLRRIAIARTEGHTIRMSARSRNVLRRIAVRVPLVALVLVSLGIASCGDIPEAGRVVAKVNGKDITYGDLIRELEAKHGPIILLDMIDAALVRQEAGKRKLTLTQQERDAGLDRAAARVGSMTDLEAKLKRSGVELEAYRADIDTNLLLDKIALQETKVTDAEVAAYYKAHVGDFNKGERVRARMMLFRDKASAEAVLEALQQPGSDFAGLAKGLSEDETTRANGGDMGYFEKDDYAAAISEAAFKQKSGETSGLIQAPDGWVILRVEGRKPAGALPLDEVKREIKQRLEAERQIEMREKWLMKARKAARLDIRNQDLKAGVEARLQHTKPMPMPGEL